MIIGMMIQHVLKIADDNCHEICELDLPANEDFDFSALRQSGSDTSKLMSVIGAAIYLNISLFNNSCDVNTMKYHSGGMEVLEAKRPIRAGEEVSYFYGEYYFLSDKFSRRKNFGFSCCCKACIENWPLQDELKDFSQHELEDRLDWVTLRVELENAAECLDLHRTKTICTKLGKLANVESPHSSLVTPEMFLNFSNLMINNSKSLKFLFLSWKQFQSSLGQ